MPRSVLFISLLFVLAVAAGGTARAFEFVGFGPKAGLGLAKLDYTGVGADDTDWRTGFVGGGFAAFKLEEGLQLQPNVLWARRGGEMEVVFTDHLDREIGRGQRRFTLDYLEIPILLRYTLDEDADISPALIAGASVAFKLSGTLEEPTVTGETETSDLDWVTGTDFGIQIGMGVDVNLQRTVLTVEGIYTLGLRDLNRSGDGDRKVRNRLVSILAGVLF